MYVMHIGIYKTYISALLSTKALKPRKFFEQARSALKIRNSVSRTTAKDNSGKHAAVPSQHPPRESPLKTQCSSYPHRPPRVPPSVSHGIAFPVSPIPPSWFPRHMIQMKFTPMLSTSLNRRGFEAGIFEASPAYHKSHTRR